MFKKEIELVSFGSIEVNEEVLVSDREVNSKEHKYIIDFLFGDNDGD